MGLGPDLISLLIAAAVANAPAAAKIDVAKTASAAWQLASGPTAFRRAQREVSNWRLESTTSLVASVAFNVSVLTGDTPRNLPRCIKLNNYWCIKRAGWAGEIASDEEGHVGFASASEGAQTAALLLRRYYVDFGRHSARAIVSHWAPDRCAAGGSYVVRRKGGGSKGGGTRTAAVRDPGLVRGSLGGTLRARFLASHGGRRAAGPSALRGAPRSVVPDYSVSLMRAPTIEAGISEAPATSAGSSLAGTSLAGLAMDLPASRGPSRSGGGKASAVFATAGPGFTCSGEIQRIDNYASRASAGITANINEDLNLFAADGSPLPNLEKIMTNMASVEIGPWKADRTLIVAAIAKSNELRLASLAAKRAAAAGGGAAR